MEKEEIWKDIPNYEGYYQASNFGRIRSIERITCIGRKRKMKILKQLLVNKYLSVRLSKDAVKKSIRVHRLVALTFIPNPDNLPQINHKDENKFNNSADNLEWCTSEYNCNYGTRIEKIKLKMSRPILQFDLKGNFIKEWKSAAEIKRELGILHVNYCCKGGFFSKQKNRWINIRHIGGYIWRYKDGEQ